MKRFINKNNVTELHSDSFFENWLYYLQFHEKCNSELKSRIFFIHFKFKIYKAFNKRS